MDSHVIKPDLFRNYFKRGKRPQYIELGLKEQSGESKKNQCGWKIRKGYPGQGDFQGNQISRILTKLSYQNTCHNYRQARD